MLRQSKLRVGCQQQLSLALRALHHVHVRAEIGDVHLRQAVLTGAEEVAGAAQFQILFCDLEAVVSGAQRLQPLVLVIIESLARTSSLSLSETRTQ
mgnify:CR=1 FL=1